MAHRELDVLREVGVHGLALGEEGIGGRARAVGVGLVVLLAARVARGSARRVRDRAPSHRSPRVRARGRGRGRAPRARARRGRGSAGAPPQPGPGHPPPQAPPPQRAQHPPQRARHPPQRARHPPPRARLLLGGRGSSSAGAASSSAGAASSSAGAASSSAGAAPPRPARRPRAREPPRGGLLGGGLLGGSLLGRGFVGHGGRERWMDPPALVSVALLTRRNVPPTLTLVPLLPINEGT